LASFTSRAEVFFGLPGLDASSSAAAAAAFFCGMTGLMPMTIRTTPSSKSHFITFSFALVMFFGGEWLAVSGRQYRRAVFYEINPASPATRPQIDTGASRKMVSESKTSCSPCRQPILSVHLTSSFS